MTTDALAARSWSRNSESWGKHKVNAGRLDIGERAHRMFKLALESALIVYLLVELRTHPVGLVEDLKAQTAALDATLGRGGQPGLIQLSGRNADAGSVRQSVR